MNKQIRRAGMRAARRNPREASRITLFGARHWQAVARATKAMRRASRVTATVRQVAANPKVTAEAKLAVSGLARAGQRARRVGIANLGNDPQVATELRQASSHASNAVAAARHPRHEKGIARATAITAGAGALGGAAYITWRSTHARPATQ